MVATAAAGQLPALLNPWFGTGPPFSVLYVHAVAHQRSADDAALVLEISPAAVMYAQLVMSDPMLEMLLPAVRRSKTCRAHVSPSSLLSSRGVPARFAVGQRVYVAEFVAVAVKGDDSEPVQPLEPK